MTKVLLVGNGRSVLDYELGELIDSGKFYVCRFNNYLIDGFETKIGTRTDLIFRRACDDVKIRDLDSNQRLVAFVTWCRWTTGMEVVGRQLKSLYGSSCHIVPAWQTCLAHDQIGLGDRNHEWASCGALAAFWLAGGWAGELWEDLKNCQIFYHGFDSEKDKHYFPKQPKDDCRHKWEKEDRYINALNIRNILEYRENQ